MWPGGSLTYGELDDRSNQLARYLRRLGVSADVLVPLCLPPGPEMLISMLGVLKSGGGYVPLDPAAPRARLAVIIADTAAPVVITQGPFKERLQAEARILCLDADGEAVAAESCAPTDYPVSPNDAAYVIYTSGSTGTPKGVIIEHGSIASFVTRIVSSYPSLRDGALLHSSPAFDLSVTTLYGVLASGGCLQISGLEEYAAHGSKEPFGFLKVTPSHLALLAGLPDECAPAGELVIAGEALQGELVQEWRRRHPHARVINSYGPTEATVGCIDYSAEPGDQVPSGPVPIGRPFSYVRAYVLDAMLHLAWPGAAGELYVAGPGLARGYLGQPGMTAGRFVACPFGAPGERMYRTGDLARWRADGELEFLGRADDQVKVRGFRIEPGEIEAVLARHAAVSQAAVAVREDQPGDKRLVAYVVSREGQAADPADVRWFAAEQLPDYMVPVVVVVPQLPLTLNGKLDRQALPAPDYSGYAEYVPPRTHREETVARVWREVLDVERIGVLSDFFELGGHSMLAVRIALGLRRELGIEVPVYMMFTAPTIAEQASELEMLLASERQTPAGAVALTLAGTAQDSPGRPVIALIHPIGGMVFCYLKLAAALGSGCQVVALSRDFSVPCAADLHELGSEYAEILDKQFPGRHILVAGWSMGGVLAHSVACGLQRREAVVSGLVMVDSFPRQAGQVNPDEPKSDAKTLAMLDEIEAAAGSGQLDALLLDPDFNGLLQSFGISWAADGPIDASALRAMLETWRALLTGSTKHQLGVFRGAACLIQATDHPHTLLADAESRWHAAVEGDLSVMRLPGNHFSMLESPAVDTLRDIITTYSSAKAPSY